MAKKRSKFAPSIEKQEGSPYLGKAGEHLVLAQLLLRRFDAALVAVDSGIDIIAEKDGRLSRIQVKARSVGSDSGLSFVLSEKALERKTRPDFYIIVPVYPDGRIEYLVFPKKILEKMIQRKLMVYRPKQKRYRAQLNYRKESWFVKNQANDVTKYLGAWELIK